MTKHPLYNLFRQMGLKPKAYSGRGMYGEECLSVQVESLDAFVGMLAETLLSNRPKLSDSESVEVVACLKAFRSDAMGHDLVIYFPWIPPPMARAAKAVTTP
jgi:hypothetical protein